MVFRGVEIYPTSLRVCVLMKCPRILDYLFCFCKGHGIKLGLVEGLDLLHRIVIELWVPTFEVTNCVSR
jgi:hypothetical protein